MATLSFMHYDRKRLKLISNSCLRGSCMDLGYAQTPNPFLNAEKTTGVDLNSNSQNTHYGEELIGDIRQLEAIVKGRRFNNIIAAELIEHLEEPYAFLRSLHEFLEPSGRLILSTPNPVAWPTIVIEWAKSRRFFYTEEHKYYFAPRWVFRLLEHTGFAMEYARGVGLWLPGFVPPAPVAFSYQVVYVAKSER